MGNSKNLIEATDANFSKDIVQTSGLALVDFWAEWCGPCRMLGPTIEQLADDFAGKVRVSKMNVDENPDTPSQFKVRGIPTVILFKDGAAVQQFVGVQPKEVYVDAIKKALS